jgi:hypothetical protein
MLRGADPDFHRDCSAGCPPSAVLLRRTGRSAMVRPWQKTRYEMEARPACVSPAGWQPAIQQIGNLRYRFAIGVPPVHHEAREGHEGIHKDPSGVCFFGRSVFMVPAGHSRRLPQAEELGTLAGRDRRLLHPGQERLLERQPGAEHGRRAFDGKVPSGGSGPGKPHGPLEADLRKFIRPKFEVVENGFGGRLFAIGIFVVIRVQKRNPEKATKQI